MKSEEKVDYTIYANQVISSFLFEMKQEFGFDCMGSGGSMPYNVRSFTILLSSEKKTTIEEARRFGIVGVQKLLKIINNHEKIRPYLNQYPFTAQDVNVTISFHDRRGRRRLKDGSISTVSYLSGKVVYRTAEKRIIHSQGVICGETGKYLIPPEDKEKEELVTILRETYEEAEAIVEKEKHSS